MSSSSATAIFREYIGGKSSQTGVPFTSVPINQKVEEFHFILAFAKDNNNDGLFTVLWNRTTYNKGTISDIKSNNANVKKVYLSIGGPRHADPPTPFYPSVKDVWILNATKSLKAIINDYQLDGLDVNYEYIDAAPNIFAECIGKVIKTLKDDGVISEASIAPSAAVENHYLTLYRQFSDYIKWVDYQFYGEDVPTASAFVQRYNSLATNSYTKGNLLAGFSTDLNDGERIKPEAFFDGCRKLIASKKLPGVFIWDADDSVNTGFQYEVIAQQLLAKP